MKYNTIQEFHNKVKNKDISKRDSASNALHRLSQRSEGIQRVVLTRQEHTELCLTSGSHRGRGGPTTRAPAAQPATPPTLGTEATCSPLPAMPPHVGTEALTHHGATTCSRQQKHVTEHNSHFLSIEAELEASLPEEPGLASPLEVLRGLSDRLSSLGDRTSKLKESSTVVPSPGFHQKHRPITDWLEIYAKLNSKSFVNVNRWFQF